MVEQRRHQHHLQKVLVEAGSSSRESRAASSASKRQTPYPLPSLLHVMLHCLKSHSDGFGGGGKSKTRTLYMKITWLMTTLLIATINFEN
jgi:hypothetical protein